MKNIDPGRPEDFSVVRCDHKARPFWQIHQKKAGGALTMIVNSKITTKRQAIADLKEIQQEVALTLAVSTAERKLFAGEFATYCAIIDCCRYGKCAALFDLTYLTGRNQHALRGILAALESRGFIKIEGFTNHDMRQSYDTIFAIVDSKMLSNGELIELTDPADPTEA